LLYLAGAGADDLPMHSFQLFLRLRFALLFVLLAGVSHAADGWGKLKVGMTRNQTVAAVGPSLFSNSGRGFAIEIYDNRAEVVYVGGRVASWTAPAGSKVDAPAMTWKLDQFSQIRRKPSSQGGYRPVVTRAYGL
jgi:hypothetical protein